MVVFPPGLLVVMVFCGCWCFCMRPLLFYFPLCLCEGVLFFGVCYVGVFICGFCSWVCPHVCMRRGLLFWCCCSFPILSSWRWFRRRKSLQTGTSFEWSQRARWRVAVLWRGPAGPIENPCCFRCGTHSCFAVSVCCDKESGSSCRMGLDGSAGVSPRGPRWWMGVTVVSMWASTWTWGNGGKCPHP